MNLLRTITGYVAKLISINGRMAGQSGCAVFSDTNTHTVNFHSFLAREDTVVNALTTRSGLSLAAGNADSKYNFTSVTLKAGELITCDDGDFFTSIDLTSGSVMVYFI